MTPSRWSSTYRVDLGRTPYRERSSRRFFRVLKLTTWKSGWPASPGGTPARFHWPAFLADAYWLQLIRRLWKAAACCYIVGAYPGDSFDRLVARARVSHIQACHGLGRQPLLLCKGELCRGSSEARLDGSHSANGTYQESGRYQRPRRYGAGNRKSSCVAGFVHPWATIGEAKVLNRWRMRSRPGGCRAARPGSVPHSPPCRRCMAASGSPKVIRFFIFTGENEDEAKACIARDDITQAAAIRKKRGIALQGRRASITAIEAGGARQATNGTLSRLQHLTDWNDGRPGTELNFKILSRQAADLKSSTSPIERSHSLDQVLRASLDVDNPGSDLYCAAFRGMR